MRSVAEAWQETTARTLEHAALVTDVTPEPAQPVLRLHQTRTGVLARFDPSESIRARLDVRLGVPADLRPARPPRTPVEEILAGPTFAQPAWGLLRDRFPEHLLPGMQHVPENTVSPMQTNPMFVEAFLVGLNHEMGRELLWREYPTDQRGTSFHRFWAPAGPTSTTRPSRPPCSAVDSTRT